MERNIKVKALQNSPFLVSLEESDVIGKGSYARVVRAFNKENMEQDLAVKIINCKDKETAATITNEINIMKNVPHHPNLVNFVKIQVSS
jgi:serine/threonine protein kinase